MIAQQPQRQRRKPSCEIRRENAKAKRCFDLVQVDATVDLRVVGRVAAYRRLTEPRVGKTRPGKPRSNRGGQNEDAKSRASRVPSHTLILYDISHAAPYVGARSASPELQKPGVRRTLIWSRSACARAGRPRGERLLLFLVGFRGRVHLAVAGIAPGVCRPLLLEPATLELGGLPCRAARP